MALLGPLPDAEIASRIGRTVGAVRGRRARLGIANIWDRRVSDGKVGRAGPVCRGMGAEVDLAP
jgi:hypothetical protein